MVSLSYGWDIILEGILHHFWLPENHNLLFFFLATVPVILDAIFRYWKIQYLNRVSPSSVATYRNMNE